MQSAECIKSPTLIPMDQDTEALALVEGQPMFTLPKDLYIPPDALEVFLEIFSGPLDLLLYLIKKQNIDILNIPVAKITNQYLAYIELMEGVRFELAAEYLLMAAMLTEIKSRLLLPQSRMMEGEETIEDPRLELVRRLQAYEQVKLTTENLDKIPRLERDIFPISIDLPLMQKTACLPELHLPELLQALSDLLKRTKLYQQHEVRSEALSLRERMSDVLARVSAVEYVEFNSLFNVREGRVGIVVTFVAILELARQQLIDITQVEFDSQIFIKAKG